MIETGTSEKTSQAQSWAQERASQNKPPPIFGGHVPQSGQSLSGMAPQANLFFLDANQHLWFRSRQGGAVRDLGFIRGVDGQIIGIDFRPATGDLVGFSDQGRFYSIDFRPSATLITGVSVPFTGGFQSLMDFNPVVDAVRLIASDDQNYAVVNNFTAFARQTDMSYAPGDVNAGQNPSIVGGAYTNSYRITDQRPKPTATTFFALDYTFDTLVYIPPINGVSPTGGGQMVTIGRLLASWGQRLNITPTADCDIYTDEAGKNHLIGVTGQILFAISLDDLTLTAPGQSQDVRVRARILPTSSLIDVAVDLRR
jgi:hypothetical protein